MNDIRLYSVVFCLITDYMVMVIRLKKMVVAVVFRNVQLVRIDKIIDFGIDRRFKSGDKR